MCAIFAPNAVLCAAEQDKSVAAYAAIPAKIMSTGQKTDVALATARIGFFHSDLVLAKKKLDEAAAYVRRGSGPVVNT